MVFAFHIFCVSLLDDFTVQHLKHNAEFVMAVVHEFPVLLVQLAPFVTVTEHVPLRVDDETN